MASAASVDINLNVNQDPMPETAPSTTTNLVAATKAETPDEAEDQTAASEDTANLVDLAVRAAAYRPEIAGKIAGKSTREVLEMALDGTVPNMDTRSDEYLLAAFDMASEKQEEATEIRETFKGRTFQVGGSTQTQAGKARHILTLRAQLRGSN